MSKNKAFSAGLGYTIGNILVKGINFLVLPLFSRIMSTEEFGVFNIFLSYDAILFAVIGLALHSSVRSAHYEFKGKIDEYVSSVTLIYWGMLFALMIVVCAAGTVLEGIIGFKLPIMIILLVYSFSSAIITLYNQRISLDYDYKSYLRISLANSLGNIALSFVLITTIYRSQKDIGRALGTTIVSAVIAIVLLISLYRKSIPRYNRAYWKFGVKYSLPIVPHGISQVLLSQFSRIMIRDIIGNNAAGLYSLAGNLRLILVIISDSISTAWNTWFYAEIETGSHKTIQKRAVQLICGFSIFVIGVMAISPELIYILGGSAYDQAKVVAVPMVLEAFVLFANNVVITSEYYRKKTQYVMGGTVCAAVINVITNSLFIPRYGFSAAAYSTLFSYACYLSLHLVISRKVIGFNVIPIKWLLFFAVLTSLMAVFDLLFIHSLVIRWSVCFISVASIALCLLLSMKKELINFNKH